MGKHLSDLIQLIIKTYLLKTYCLTIFKDGDLDLKENLPMLVFDSKNLSGTLLESLDRGCSDYIIFVEDPIKFMEIFDENIHITNQRRGNRKLIFLPFFDSFEHRKVLGDILKLEAISFVPDVLLILPTCNLIESDEGCPIYELGTQKYVGLVNNTDLLLLDIYNSTSGTFEKNSNLFPDKLSNMEGRVVRMATFSYKPYAILEVDENDEIIGLDGTEMKAAIEFCNWLNCTIEIIRDDEHEWGEIWDNRTGNGILGNVVIDKADIGYGALYSWYHEYNFLDLTMPIVRTGITVIAPVPKLIASWLLPVLPFNGTMWSSVFIALLIGAIGIFITGRVKTNPFSILESLIATLGIFVQQVPVLNRPPIALRTVILFLLLLSLLISNIYSSGLSSSITVPRYEDPINTVQELVDSNLDWGATHDAWIFSILLSTEPNIVRLVDKFKKWPEAKLKSKGKTRDFAYSVERLPAGHFAIGEYVTEETVPYLQLMVEDIYWEQCVFMSRKSSPFTRKINTFFSRLHQSSLPHFWETQVVLKHANFKVQLAVKLSLGRHGDGNVEPRPLGIRHFQGSLFLWLFGLVTAAIILLFELSYKRFSKK